MFEYYQNYRSEIELPYFSKNNIIYNKNKLLSSKCSTQGIIMLDKETNLYKPFQIKCNNWDCEECSSQKAEILKSKLNIIAPKEDFSFFLTITTAPINLFKKDLITKRISKNFQNLSLNIQNVQRTTEISILFKKYKNILTEYDKSLNLNKIKSRYKYKTLKQSEKKKQLILKNWFQYEIEVQINKIIRKDSIIKIAKMKRIFFNNLSEEQQAFFLRNNKNLIDKEFNKNFEKKKTKILTKKFINSKKIWFEEVITRNQDKERSYFLVVEATKNKHPHLHILINRFIPSFLIEKNLGLESKIYKNLDLKTKIEDNDKFYKKSINYVLKYFFKSFEGENTTYLFLKNLNKQFRLYYFSSNLYKKYPFLKIKQKSTNEKRFEKVDYFVGKLTSENLTFDPSKYPNKLTLELELQKYKSKITNNVINHNCLNISSKINQTLKPYQDILSKFNKQLNQNLGAGFLLNSILNSANNEIFSKFPSRRQGNEEKLNDLDLKQTETLDSIINNKITICIGDGGSGKTTILKELNKIYSNKCKITYCCLTAQSCVNINKKLNLINDNEKAKTIHKTFNNIFSKYTIKFKNNETNILKTDILVIDEFTMVDKEIFYNILKGISQNTHILLLGDNKQLSNFKSNSLFYELKKIKKINIIELKGQYRSNYKVLNKINKFLKNKNIDLLYSENELNKIILKTMKNKNTKILCNTNELVKKINLMCFELDSENRNIKTLSLYDFKIGDIVMNTKNNYLLDGLSNGENLTIISNDEKKNTILVQRNLNNKILEIPLKDTFYLIPAYALTIHKSQGSEFENGFILIENTKGIGLCNKNIVYTACSRFRNSFKLYFLDDKAKNKSYKHSSSELNNDLFEFQKPKELLTCLSKELLSNPQFRKSDLSVI